MNRLWSKNINAYHFGPFSFDAKSLELRRCGERVTIRVQPARLLLCLLKHAPETVSLKQLQEQIWENGMAVEFEQGLNACVNQLRIALGDSASQPRFIETLPKRSY